MERYPHQRFALHTIECVCTVLELELEEVLLPDEPGDILVTGPKKVDFRPAQPWTAPNWEDSRLIIALDKLGFCLGKGVKRSYTLEAMHLTVPEVANGEVFKCHYLSRVAPGMTNHLGIEREFSPQIVSPGHGIKPRAWSFKSAGDLGLCYGPFHEALATPSIPYRNTLQVDVILEFSGGISLTKELKLSIAQAHAYMNEVRKAGQSLLKFMQLEVLD